ncbi:hypothetical protein [Flavobacterium sp.]|uniref:hypothetical protein n=1 Tax=Flavobacterium sp. TaxID=239 RepID=UPI0033420CCE
MENIILNQFAIGEEFSLHEFELEYKETKTDKNGLDYDYYRYVGDLNSIEVKNVILIYNCDVLRGAFCFS